MKVDGFVKGGVEISLCMELQKPVLESENLRLCQYSSHKIKILQKMKLLDKWDIDYLCVNYGIWLAELTTSWAKNLLILKEIAENAFLTWTFILF